MNEKRIVSRRRTYKAGRIAFGDTEIDCIVRNLSETGANIEVVTPLRIPDRFKLLIRTDDFSRDCRTVWRKYNRTGVIFL